MNVAPQKLYHPATIELLRNQSRAKLGRIVSSFRNPRRQVLAVIAIVLGLVWVSQAIASVIFREAADPQQLLIWLPLGFFVYSAWHVIKTATRKPVEPFEWTPAETELVRSAPITRTQLISYRMASIVQTSLIKACCFSIVMIPDLNIWAAGFLGMFLGLVLIDLIRVSSELFFHGLSTAGQWFCRLSVIGAILGFVGLGLFRSMTGPESASDIASPGGLLFLQNFVGELVALGTTGVGASVLILFKPFVNVILADQFSATTLGYTLLSFLLVGAAGCLVYQLDAWMQFRTSVKERRAYQRGIASQNTAAASTGSRHLRKVSVPWRMRGIGSIAWRQLLGAYHYRTTVLVSLGLPTLLCCIPLLADHNPYLMLVNVVAGAVFYSFLLLPSALILDFRRDIDRMVVLKALPISPVAMTVGQLTAPVVICSAFQWSVLGIATMTGKVILWQAVVAAILLLPVNTLIFAIENFIFLLSPYRRNQEGIDVFLRTILTFTSKGILFGVALALTVAWMLGSKAIAAMFSDSLMLAGLVFAVGGWLMTATVAAGFVYGIVRLYSRFDPSQDGPAVS